MKRGEKLLSELITALEDRQRCQCTTNQLRVGEAFGTMLSYIRALESEDAQVVATYHRLVP